MKDEDEPSAGEVATWAEQARRIEAERLLRGRLPLSVALEWLRKSNAWDGDTSARWSRRLVGAIQALELPAYDTATSEARFTSRPTDLEACGAIVSVADLNRWLDETDAVLAQRLTAPPSQRDEGEGTRHDLRLPQRRQQALAELLEELGYGAAPVPRAVGGRTNELRSKIKQLALQRHPKLFTDSTFDKAWKSVPKANC